MVTTFSTMLAYVSSHASPDSESGHSSSSRESSRVSSQVLTPVRCLWVLVVQNGDGSIDYEEFVVLMQGGGGGALNLDGIVLQG